LPFLFHVDKIHKESPHIILDIYIYNIIRGVRLSIVERDLDKRKLS